MRAAARARNQSPPQRRVVATLPRRHAGSSPDPILHLTLRDGRDATLRLAAGSTVLAIGGEIVSSWDLAGRPYALVRENGTYRRGLDGGLLLKQEARGEEPRVRRRLSAEEGTPVVEAARREAALALDAVAGASAGAVERLRAVLAMDAASLAADAARFATACGRVVILPPDQYLSLVVRLTEGCSWNACSFCSLYRDVPFRARSQEELALQLAALRDYFGTSLALRRSLFLGDANALCLAQPQLLSRLREVTEAFPGRALFSFVDAWTGRRKTADDWRECARLGLRRVYVGLESGDPALLSWLEKPGTPQDAVELVAALHEAGVAAGVIVLVGAGGERFAAGHVARSAETLRAMHLGPDDIVYFSEYVDDPTLAYGRRAAASPDLRPLPPERARAQREAITLAIRAGDTRPPGSAGAPRPARPRTAAYDLREFVY